MVGDPPSDTHCRRNLNAMLDGRRLVVLGAAPPALRMVFVLNAASPVQRIASRSCHEGLQFKQFTRASSSHGSRELL